ncbi:MAG: carbohydrate binding family 9 domain-containing protein [Phycisphaerales bacterium]|nr:carbohydrate binding family 9 domain-containing protein [Phycisphaerales bacterium]
MALRPNQARRSLGAPAAVAGLLVGLTQLQGPAVAQPAPPAASLAQALAEIPPRIDGLLDEPAWADAPILDAFTQVDPVNGAQPTERTEVRLLYDADTLYIGVRCLDGEPGAIVARSMARDADHATDDRITLAIDTFRDRRNGYVFVVSAAGGKRDGLVEASRVRWDWDGLWDARARVDDRGWTAEIAIPAKTLSFDPAGSTWGFNLERYIKRKSELDRWASPSRDAAVTKMSDAGELTELARLRQGLGLTVKPFFTGKLDLDSRDLKIEPGLDVFYKIDPSTTAALTINTDFAEAEVDERRVNLTRFPLFYPEKRDFFLEDSGIFEFGGINQSPRPYFSRRIGIVRGEQEDLLAGMRLTGRQGALRFGLLDVQMKDDDVLGAKNLGVLRFKHDVGEQGSIGIIATNGDPGNRGANQLVGLDASLLDTEALGGRVSADAWIMATHDDPAGVPAENDDPFALGGRVNYNADPWSGFLFADHVGHDFRPALGFVQRPGRREFDARLAYTWRPETHDWIRSVAFTAFGSAYTTFANDIESADLEIPTITLTTNSADSVFAGALVSREVLDEPFEIVRGVTIPTGEYDDAGWHAGFNTADARWLALSGEYADRGSTTAHGATSPAR